MYTTVDDYLLEMKRIAGMNKAIKQRDNGISKMSTLKLTFK